MKKIVQKILALMAHALLIRHKPFVIGVTGSIGKTTTKDALFAILSTRYTVRTNRANYNNEFGVPLTIIGAETGGKSLIGWMRVFLIWIYAMVHRTYPEILVVELGIDHVGDMDYLVNIIHPHMGIVTRVEGVHAEKFGSIATIAKEKSVLIRRLPESGDAILNADDERVLRMKKYTHARATTYSAQGNKEAALYVSDKTFSGHGGISFKVNKGQTTVPVRLPHIIGMQMIPSIMAAITAAHVYGMNLVDIARAIEHFKPPHRRMNLLTIASCNITIIDDSYNAAPASVRAALATLHALSARSRRVAILGDMRELGDVEDAEHRALSVAIEDNNIDVVITVGEKMLLLHKRLIASCKKQHRTCAVYHYTTLCDAVDAVSTIVRNGDTVLIKGSHGMRMWEVTEKLMQMKCVSKCIKRQ